MTLAYINHRYSQSHYNKNASVAYCCRGLLMHFFGTPCTFISTTFWVIIWSLDHTLNLPLKPNQILQFLWDLSLLSRKPFWFHDSRFFFNTLDMNFIRAFPQLMININHTSSNQTSVTSSFKVWGLINFHLCVRHGRQYK